RCDTTIVRRRIRQWMLKITAYADRLLEDLDELDWNDSIKLMQKNWIGKSEGAEVDFQIDGFKEKLKIYTTRPDTLFGATYMVLSPEHPVLKTIVAPEYKTQIEDYINEASKKSDLQRTDLNKEKTGVFTGRYAINPVNNKKIPIWISDYVLIDYGTGAIMAVPAHDTRDFEFAKKFDLPIVQVVSKTGEKYELSEAETEEGIAVNSGEFDGLTTIVFKNKITEWLEKKGVGKKATNYKLRDWVFSRQRYWGEPFPIVHCDKCGIVPLPESELPLKLPEVESYKPTGDGESPLVGIDSWVNATCPKCGGKAKRETNTMPQWAGSCWYYLRFMDPKNDEALASQESIKYWESVNLYIGGAEHAVLHLLYARFWHKFLYDIGVVHTKEPFHALRNQGMILGENGEKMSKSRGNVINPDDVIAEHGADTLRMYLMFIGPLNVDKPWNTQSIYGIRRFLERVYRLLEKPISDDVQTPIEIDKILHKTIKIVTEKLEALEFNTAISQMMILLNSLSKEEKLNKTLIKNFVQILHPFAPFVTEEMWSMLGEKPSILNSQWPSYDITKTIDDAVTVVFQVNGKLRAKCEVQKGLSKKQLIDIALENDRVKEFTAGKEIINKIAVPDKLVNIVVK
ncbi:MAG TPA: leucine--tRNA ligase, partial [Spirochaetota bacterium]|nr:leucine--tRNA ligase [Spirochaetota bacterium]